jgi:hypothetical protein
MKLRCPVFLLVMLLVGCAQLPRLQTPADSAVTPACEGLFPQGCWELVHTIQAAPPGGRIQTMIGASRICSAERSIHCVLMSLEGLVLFEADYDGGISVRRAVGPLSRDGFADGLIQDILLIFFAPQGELQCIGRLADGSGVCRYAAAGNQTRDIIALPRGGWQIRAYDARKRLARTVTYAAPESGSPGGLASRIELQAHGLAGYRLEMTLVEAHRL